MPRAAVCGRCYVLTPAPPPHPTHTNTRSALPHCARAGRSQPGLLSQAFRGGAGARAFNRAVSLSNLLDAPILPADGGQAAQHQAAQPDAPQQAAQQQQQQAAGGGTDEGEARKWRKGRSPPQWPGKASVIELLNELLEELDGIEQQIAQQAVEHIHANEVRAASCCCWCSWQPQRQRQHMASIFRIAATAHMYISCRACKTLLLNARVTPPAPPAAPAVLPQVILTYGMSDTTFLFLKEASRKREFQV